MLGPATLGLADPSFVTASGGAIVDAGTDWNQVLTGGAGRNVFVLHAGIAVGRELVAQLAEFAGADAGEGEGIEDEQGRRPSQLGEGDDLLVLVGKAEFGCAVTDGEGHAPMLPHARWRVGTATPRGPQRYRRVVESPAL